MFDLVRYLHLLAAAVWLGGLLTLAALVPTLRRAGADRPMLQAVARQFGRLSWTAMGVSLVTGVIQVLGIELGTSFRTEFGQRLFVKLIMVGVAVSLALFHQLTARNSSPAVRGTIEGLILVASLGIFAAAITL